MEFECRLGTTLFDAIADLEEAHEDPVLLGGSVVLTLAWHYQVCRSDSRSLAYMP